MRLNMERKLKYRTYMLIAMALLFPGETFAQKNNDKVQQAIDIIQKFCVAKGSELKIEGDISGKVRLKSILGSGVDGNLELSAKQAEGLVGELNEISAGQASEMRECMKPYIDTIISAIIGPQVQEGNMEFKIVTKSPGFHLKDFDNFICSASRAVSGDGSFWVTDVVSKAKRPIIWVRYYANIANDNGMIDSYTAKDYRFAKKGNEYVIAKQMFNGDCSEFQ